ncbi:MAG: hypothetical protein CMJ81_16615 [Planctomycetaceae bacterium]|nr:hypothetical protein [Planctomycetaceae bacterium]
MGRATAPGLVSKPAHDRVTVDMDSKLPVQQVLWLLRAPMGETLHRRLSRQCFADPGATADRMNCRSLATFHGTLCMRNKLSNTRRVRRLTWARMLPGFCGFLSDGKTNTICQM